MKNHIVFSTKDNNYIYSCTHKETLPLHPVLQRIIQLYDSGNFSWEKDEFLRSYTNAEIDYYLKKYRYWKEMGLIGIKDKVEYAPLSVELIRKELENLQVLTFVVTDKCNLKCRYCAYGDMYNGYDARTDENLSFDKAKHVLDYLFDIWTNASSMSAKRTVNIGFYGGEPLMNIELIKQIVEYVSEHTFPHIEFQYNMTTNAMLLGKCQDFLQQHEVRLLISLDGTEEDDCHRITANGSGSFNYVFPQIKKLKETYPSYFEKCVSFNSVLHSKSNVARIVDFFEEEFGKSPMLSELTRQNVVDRTLFNHMFLNVQEAIMRSGKQVFIDKKLMYVSPNISALTSFLYRYTSETFKDYRSMFYGTHRYSNIPTGTCIPFNRKFVVTTNGKIMVCEHIDHKYAVGKVNEKGVHLNLEEIAQRYNEKYYKRIIHLCKNCYVQHNCVQCVFQTEIDKEPVKCNKFYSYQEFAKYLATNLGYMEQNRWAYGRIMKEVTLF